MAIETEMNGVKWEEVDVDTVKEAEHRGEMGRGQGGVRGTGTEDGEGDGETSGGWRRRW